MSKTLLIGAAAVVLGGVGWYLFRPERLFVDQKVRESFPEAAVAQAASEMKQNTVLAEGSFHGVAHKTIGQAAVYQLPDGKRLLRFTDFETSNGPDVQVYLVAADDANDNDTVTKSGFVHVGALKGNIGDQNYELSADVDLEKYRAVTIWCRRFGVNFATAPLKPRG
jgi:hypothetical protein